MSQQRGYGLGGVFRSAGRHIKPLLGEVGKVAATAGADLAKNLIGDVIEGKSVSESDDTETEKVPTPKGYIRLTKQRALTFDLTLN